MPGPRGPGVPHPMHASNTYVSSAVAIDGRRPVATQLGIGVRHRANGKLTSYGLHIDRNNVSNSVVDALFHMLRRLAGGVSVCTWG